MTNRYLIAAVSRLTGLSADTIRAWEKRHRIVSPSRAATGVRMYNEDDVERLDLARTAVELGHPIRRVAALSNGELLRLIDRERSLEAKGVADNAASRTISDFLRALEQYEVERGESLLRAAALLMTPVELIIGVLSPLMRAVGDRWESGRISIAQEHLASQLVRNLIVNIARTSVVSKKRTMLFAAPAGETHELGLLFAATLTAAAGVKRQVVGSDVPARELIRAARRLQPDIVVIATLRDADEMRTAAYCAELIARLPQRSALWLGGHPSGRAALPSASSRSRFIGSLEEFARRVVALN